MPLLDLLLLWFAIGAALFVADLLFTPRAEFADLWRHARSCAAPAWAVIGIAIGVLVTLLRWALLWPLVVAPSVRRWGRR